MFELRPYQQEAVEAVYEHLRTRDDNPCVVLPTGCHAKDHPILMYDGTMRRVQDVRVDDQIMGNDSTPRNVLALCRGRERMYRIMPLRGEDFIVNENHILSLVSTNEGKNSPSHQKGGEITNISVKEYLKKAKSWKHLRKLYRVPVDYDIEVDLPMPPYILGLLIGDGCIAHSVSYTSADEELGDEFIRYADSMGCRVSVKENSSGVPTYSLVYSKGSYNPVKLILECLGLWGHLAESKFIPHRYLVSSRNSRLQILAGLLDSDGYLTCGGFEYTTKSQELADDIAQLARSLGFRVVVNEKYSSCQTGAGGWYFRLHINGDISVIPCRRKRHTNLKQVRRQKKNVLRTGFSVEELPEDDFFGFTLDGNHLYVDGNFFVHHNTGKSLCIAQIVSDAVQKWFGRVLILAHVKELLEQNADKIRVLCPELDVGVYSAGLNSRDTDHAVIVAGIQSVYNKACELGPFDLIVIDEAHLLNSDAEDSMYKSFLNDMKVINPHVRLIGLTATPFRMKGGLICKPENLLNHICYEAGLKEMIEQGYLSPLVSRAGRAEACFDKLHIRGGEFISSEVEDLMDNSQLVDAACREIVSLTQDRNSVLIFTSSVEHCQHVAEKIAAYSGKECGVVTGSTLPGLRAEIIARFKGEEVPADFFSNKKPLKYLANVNVLTTGFDATNTDCIVLLRPTNSAGLLVQMVGRGTRLHPGKQDCLILDYGGNIMRHGPVDMIQVKESGNGEAPAKKCPECLALIHAAYMACPECGYKFPLPEKSNLNAHAESAGVLSGQVDYFDYDVHGVEYNVHFKRGAPDDAPKTMRIEYCTGFNQYKSEWVCPEHIGYARRKFEAWWKKRSKVPPPNSAVEAVRLADDGALVKPSKIIVKSVAGEKFDRIVDYELGEIPEYAPEPGYYDAEPYDEWSPANYPDEDFDEDDIPF